MSIRSDRPWPNGYVSGWCSSSIVADHARCCLEHVADASAPGCHCRPCATPAVVVEVEPTDAALEAAVAAAEWLGDSPDTGAAAPATEPAAAPVTTLPDAPVTEDAQRLLAVLDLHAALAPIRSSSTVRPSCRHCGRAYPCPTVRRVNGDLEAAA